jgi:hypothetical protein
VKVVRSDFAMSDLQNLSISEEAEETITTKSGANLMAPTTSMYELTGITFEVRKGGRTLFFLSLGTTTTGAESLRGLACGASDRQGRCCCSPSAFLGLMAVLELFWGDENKRKIVRGHLNRSLENIIALIPWDKSWNLRRYLPRPIALCASIDCNYTCL